MFEKFIYSHVHRGCELVRVQNEKVAVIKSELSSEIESLQSYYTVLKGYMGGAGRDVVEVAGALRVFRDGLSRVSAHVLALYEITGQRTKITWEPLLENLDNALEALRGSVRGNPGAAVELGLSMSEPNAAEVMGYLSKLQESLR